jgi:head-tail adaptor
VSRRTLDPGQLREAVTVQAPAETLNSFGEQTIQWSDFASRRASIRGLRTDELMSAQGLYNVATHEVEMRYVAGLSPDMRLIWTSRSPVRILDIVSVTENGNRESHRLVVKEQVA